ncbi:MAG TPA: MarR family transcriptional regulator [Rhodothermales bacterium]|nr:MarR family transcriptional regulator [Rhodothermales bacterium]
MKLSELIRQDHFATPGQEALFNVVVSSNWILGSLAAAMAPHSITPAQYNVLRILRGSHPNTLTCSEIGQRLLDRTPDVTRLLNRLERSGYIVRERADHDRRVVEVTISQKGLDLLEQMRSDVDREVDALTQHLSPEEHQQLSNLLERLRTDQQA